MIRIILDGLPSKHTSSASLRVDLAQAAGLLDGCTYGAKTVYIAPQYLF